MTVLDGTLTPIRRGWQLLLTYRASGVMIETTLINNRCACKKHSQKQKVDWFCLYWWLIRVTLVAFDFCPQILESDGDLWFILCHSITAGSVMRIPWSVWDTQILPTFALHSRAVGTQKNSHLSHLVKLSITNFVENWSETETSVDDTLHSPGEHIHELVTKDTHSTFGRLYFATHQITTKSLVQRSLLNRLRQIAKR